jgi:hypothetical protein
MDLQGICLFPAVDMPDWHTGAWLHNGLCDLGQQDGDLRRVPDRKGKRAYRQWCRSTSAQRMDACDNIPDFNPAPRLLSLGLGRGVAYALGRELCSLLGGSVAFVDIPVSHIPSHSQVASCI